MGKRLIGSAYTNSNGVATITYTGSGAGILNIVAEANNGNLQSPQFQLIDTYKYDWYNHSNRLTVTDTSGDITLANNSGTGGFYLVNAYGTSKSSLADLLDWSPSFVVEFDVVSISSDVRYQVYDGSAREKTASELGLTGNNHLKVIVTSTSVIFYVDGVSTATITANMGTSRTGFVVPNGSSVEFMNLIIYPI